MDDHPTDLHSDQARPPAGSALLGGLTVPLGVVAIGVLVLIFDGHEVSWLAGVIAGGGAGAWVALRRGGRPPSPSRRAAPSRAPSTGPGARSSRCRRAGWRFLHGLRGLDTTFDHVAIGRGGVIVLQSISPDGVVTIRGGEPILERRRATAPGRGSSGCARAPSPTPQPSVTTWSGSPVAASGFRRWSSIWSDSRRAASPTAAASSSTGPGWAAGSPVGPTSSTRPDRRCRHTVAALVDCGGELPLPLAV